MKNSGGFIKRRIPLGDHKEPAPEDLPLVGQRFAGDGDRSVDAASTNAGPKGPDATQEGENPANDPKPKPASRSSAQKRVSSTPNGIDAKRYTLVLKIETHLVASAAKTNALSRPDLKRALLTELKNRVLQSGGKAKNYSPKSTTPVRVDLRLSDEMVEKIVGTERQSTFEPVSTVLARFVSGHYASMLREVIDAQAK